MASLTKSRLKIGLVLDDSLDKVDGVQQYVLAIGKWLSGQGHDVHYLVGETRRQDIDGVHSLSRNLKVRFNGNRMSMPLPTSKAKLRQLLAREQFDILHVQMPYSPYLAHRLIMAADRQTAVIGTFHIIADGVVPRLATRLLATWTRRSLRRFDDIVSVSSGAAAFAKVTFGLHTPVLPNVFDYQLFHQAEPLEKYRDDMPTILFLGRLVPRKGCQLLLSAIAELRQRPNCPDFRVLVCGKGPLATKVKAYVARNDLSAMVEFVGFVSEADKPRYYASSDIAVFPSRGGESFGIVLLEAMASGRSVVLAGDNPGYRSVMTDQPQLLFDPHDIHALADLLMAYLSDDTKRSAAANWGMVYSRDFDTARIGEKLLSVYQQALHKRRQP